MPAGGPAPPFTFRRMEQVMMTTTKTIRSLGIGVLVLPLALAVAGCGDSSPTMPDPVAAAEWSGMLEGEGE